MDRFRCDLVVDGGGGCWLSGLDWSEGEGSIEVLAVLLFETIDALDGVDNDGTRVIEGYIKGGVPVGLFPS